MSYKKATFAALTVLCILGAAYLWAALGFQDNRNRNVIGPGYFPISLAVILLLLCAGSAIQTIRRPDHTVALPNLGLVAAGLVLTGLFLFVWAKLDLFYPAVFGFVFVLLTVFSRKRMIQALLLYVAIAAALTLFVYLLFGVLIGVRF